VNRLGVWLAEMVQHALEALKNDMPRSCRLADYWRPKSTRSTTTETEIKRHQLGPWYPTTTASQTRQTHSLRARNHIFRARLGAAKKGVRLLCRGALHKHDVSRVARPRQIKT